MRRDRRLRRSSDFAALRRRGRRWSDRLLVLVARPNGLGVTRFGFAVGKRLGKAVVRNKVKRRLREAARRAPVKEGWDLLVVARKEAPQADYHALRSSLEGLLNRAGLLEGEQGPHPSTAPREAHPCEG